MWIWINAANAADCGAEWANDRLPTLEAQLAFDHGKASVAAASGPALDAVACVLEATPARHLHVEVHSDARGNDTYNLELSQDRADALRQALIARGIDATRVSAIGHGESMPLTTEGTAEAIARNRRVELWGVGEATRPPRPTAPASPAPSPSAAAPAPALAPDPCVAWRAVTVDYGFGACTAGPRWTCVLPGTLAKARADASRCLASANVDGEAWFLSVPGGLVRLAPAADGRPELARASD